FAYGDARRRRGSPKAGATILRDVVHGRLDGVRRKRQPMFTRKASSWLCAVLSVLALGASQARAQCVGPDGLDGGPCCAPASVNLPAFPLMSQDMRWLCF